MIKGMKISHIVAMDNGAGIGKGGKIPWELSGDLKRFRTLTKDHYVLVGRKTWESFPSELPGRKVILLTRDRSYKPKKPVVAIAHKLEDALDIARYAGEYNLFVIGGAEIYALTQHMMDELYLTRIYADRECDTFYPGSSSYMAMKKLASTGVLKEKGNKKNPLSYEYQKLGWRRSGAPKGLEAATS